MNEHHLSILLILFLQLIAAFFSIAETALTAASRPRMHQMAKDGNRKAKLVNELRSDSESLIGAILLGNNLVNILATAVATSTLTEIFGEAGVIYATAIMTVVILVIGEVVPKTYAMNSADSVALSVAAPIRAWMWFSWPVTVALGYVTRLFMRLFRLNKTNLGEHLSDDELRGAIDLHGANPAGLSPEIQKERKMLHSILDLQDVTVAKVMTHRRNVVMLDIDEPVDSIIRDVLASPFTRIPLWQDNASNIIGILHVKSLVRALQSGTARETLSIKTLIAKPWFIPETASLLEQLQAFRDRREHFAFVVDEYGVFEGIVTLEDILEEIVGEISDEHDQIVSGVRRQPDGSFIVQGTVAIRDVNREFAWELPEERATTLAGLVMLEARRIPEIGQAYSFYGFRFDIIRRQRNQITLLRLTPPNATKESSNHSTDEINNS
ncbi:MAG: HlyC/CorC family transporter [Holosporales bacterium]|jgi:Mg2+/Co2+ transporter CorB